MRSTAMAAKPLFAWGLLAGALLLPVAGCGTNSQDRTTGGAAAGAATGAGIGLLGGPVGVLVGGAIGAGAGAVTGGATKPSQLNLGKPPWSNPETRVPTANGTYAPATGQTTQP